ncbi:MAG: phosphatase PAP2 family protein [Alphaproteobacteria bacterium]|nr:phosphatase PAP2 family protein [Alphaproteobacteria bacterium]
MGTFVSRLSLLAAFCLALFLALAYGSMAIPAVQNIDAAVDAALSPMRTKPLLTAFLWVTPLGAGATLLAVMLTATGFLWNESGRPFLRPLWIVYLGTEAMTWGTKFILDRERPVFLEVASAASPSFPSAHTAGAAAVYCFFTYILMHRATPDGSARVGILAVATLIIAAVALSRVALGVHFFSDVLGGLAVAGLWLCFGVATVRKASSILKTLAGTSP